MRPALLAALPVACALAVYAGVQDFGFVGDDVQAIAQHEALHAGEPWRAAFGSYTSLANRPIACAMLAAELALGLGPGGMHVMALLLHAANALLAFVAVAACLRAPAVGLSPDRARAAACAVACLWAVHPLHVDAVAYLTQRSQLLAGGFALAAFAALARSREAARAGRWQALAVAATALALASKEEAAALPLLLVLADAVLWPAPGRRAGFRFALLATYGVLLLCVALGPRNPTVGFATIPPCSAWESLLTQCQSLAHYAVAAVWPIDLRGQYDFAIVRTIASVAGRGIAIVVALGCAALAWRLRPALAWALACVFLLLAPTSSILPIVTEPCADRRMYLPLLVLLALLAAWLARRGAIRALVVFAVGAAAMFAVVTRATLPHYRDDTSSQLHAGAANELQNGSFMAGRILTAYASALQAEAEALAAVDPQGAARRRAQAADCIERALRCEAPGADTRLNHANLLEARGDGAGAEAQLRRLVADYPTFAKGLGNLARLLLARAAAQPAQAAALHAEADDLSARAVAAAPRDAVVANTRGVCCYTLRGADDALPHLQRALALQPDYFEAQRNLGIAWQALGEPQRALDCWRPLLARRPADPVLQQQVRDAEAAVARGR
jgi:tetratricopeptide (TPR) repeat protein